MELVTEKPAVVFDLSKIRRGDLLWGRHCTWRDGRSGMVTSATEAQLTVQYCPGIGNITNHFIIPATEAAGGEWKIRWSADLTEVQEYGGKEENGLPDTEDEEEPKGPGEAAGELPQSEGGDDLQELKTAEEEAMEPKGTKDALQGPEEAEDELTEAGNGRASRETEEAEASGNDSAKTGGEAADELAGTDL